MDIMCVGLKSGALYGVVFPVLTESYQNCLPCQHVCELIDNKLECSLSNASPVLQGLPTEP